MHGHTTPRFRAHDPKAARIAELSEEYLVANARRRREIGEEIAGLISGRIVPLRRAETAN